MRLYHPISDEIMKQKLLKIKNKINNKISKVFAMESILACSSSSIMIFVW